MIGSTFYLVEEPTAGCVRDNRLWFIHKEPAGLRQRARHYAWPTRRGARSWTSREKAEKARPDIEAELRQEAGQARLTLRVHEHTPEPKPDLGDLFLSGRML